jgi:RHS repeat-associated protein
VYASNESNVQVFFDNLQLVHNRGPLVDETHYYAFGLTMAGISSKAANMVENKTKYQQYELNTDFDINLYESFYRSHDPQLGRFWQIDPKPNEFESPYAAMGNNPISNIDILGDTIELGGSVGCALEDVRSTVPANAQQFVSVNSSNVVQFDVVGLREKYPSLMKDKGVVLLESLVTACENYLYSVANTANVNFVSVEPYTGRVYNPDEVGVGRTNPMPKTINLLGKDENGITNAVNRPAGSLPGDKGRDIFPPYLTPKRGSKFAAEITIADVPFVVPEIDAKRNHTVFLLPIPRASGTLHELSEAFNRVSGSSYLQAHNAATKLESGLKVGDPRRSPYPGFGGTLATYSNLGYKLKR